MDVSWIAHCAPVGYSHCINSRAGCTMMGSHQHNWVEGGTGWQGAKNSSSMRGAAMAH